LAPDLVFNLGIWLSSRLDAFLTFGGAMSPVRASEKNRHGSPYGPAVLKGPAHTRKSERTQGRRLNRHGWPAGRRLYPRPSDFKRLGAFFCNARRDKQGTMPMT
jgi:hypothetical protein